MLFRVLDFETTGLPENEGSRVCEAGWCDVSHARDGWEIDGPYWQLCDPGCAIPPEVRALHHITDAELQGKPTFDEVKPILCAGPPDYFVAHNSKFEQHFFTGAPTPWICTYRSALRLWPDAPSHSNQVLRYFLGMELDERAMPPHRAAPDAFVTAHLLVACLRHGGATIGDMVRWSSGPPLLPRVNFGKHFGAKWEDVPTDYLDWIINKSDMDNDIKANARHHIASARQQPQHNEREHMDTEIQPEVAKPETTLPDGDYAIVECMGHSTIIGRYMEVERFGNKMLQIEPIFCGELLPPILQAGSSLYRFTPCSKEVAAARGAKSHYQLPDAVRAALPPTALPAPSTEVEEIAENESHVEFEDEEEDGF